MAFLGENLTSFSQLNEARFEYIESSRGVKVPVIPDISNPPPNFVLVEGGIYFDQAQEKLYVAGSTGVLEEVSSAPPGGGGGTIEGAQNIIGGTGLFDSITNGGITLLFKSLASTSTVTPSVNGFGNIDLSVTGSPALQINGTNFSIPATPTNGQVLGWDGSGLEWTTPSGGGGGDSLPFEHRQNHFVDSSGGVGNEKFLQLSLANITNGSTVSMSIPSGSTGTQEVVFPSSSQTLTNKILDSTTNEVAASKLFVDPVTSIDLPSSGPSSGEVLTFSGGNLVWDTPSGGGGIDINTSNIIDAQFITNTLLDFGAADIVNEVRTKTVATAAGDLPVNNSTVLVRNQSGTDSFQNGLYVLQTAPPASFTRVPDSVSRGQIYNVTESDIIEKAYFVEGTGDLIIDTDDIDISTYKGAMRNELSNDLGYDDFSRNIIVPSDLTGVQNNNVLLLSSAVSPSSAVNSIVIGSESGRDIEVDGSILIGVNAGGPIPGFPTGNLTNCVAIGRDAGQGENDQTNVTSIGFDSGFKEDNEGGIPAKSNVTFIGAGCNTGLFNSQGSGLVVVSDNDVLIGKYLPNSLTPNTAFPIMHMRGNIDNVVNVVAPGKNDSTQLGDINGRWKGLFLSDSLSSGIGIQFTDGSQIISTMDSKGLSQFYGHGIYQNSTNQGLTVPFTSGGQKIVFFTDSLVDGSGADPFTTNVTLVNPTTAADEEFTYFTNTSTRERLWNISVKILATTLNPETFTNLEMFVNVVDSPPTSNSDVSTNIQQELIGYNRVLNSPVQQEFITINTVARVPIGQHVFIVVGATTTNSATWNIGGVGGDRTTITITELPN